MVFRKSYSFLMMSYFIISKINMTKKIFCLFVSLCLLSCESVIGFRGIVTDADNVPLVDVVIYKCFDRCKADSVHYPMGYKTDSSGRFEIITMTSFFVRKKTMCDFVFEKDGFIPDTVRLKPNAFESHLYKIQLKKD